MTSSSLLPSLQSGSVASKDQPQFHIREYVRKSDKRGRKLNYVADFETTTVVDDCRVWGWGLVPLGSDWQSLSLDNVQVGTQLEDFLEEISQSNTTCYFHNLRFDGRFILDWILKAGYLHVAKGPVAGQFTSMISDMGQFYSITVRWLNGYTTEFRDSLKKLPMSVAQLAKAFKMDTDGLDKGDIDYEAPRGRGYIITPEEADYIRRDVLIVARALGQQLANGLTKLTVGSDALHEFKQIIGKQTYDRLFPILSVDMDAEIRRAYRGGFTYADPRFSGRTVGSGVVLDVNSLYPSVMYHKPIPYGEPEWVVGQVSGTRARPLTIFSVTFTARIKPGHIPCIQIKGSSRFTPTEYLSNINDPVSLMVTNIDYQLMHDHYDMDVLSFDGGWRFAAANGIFDTYIDKWMRIKEHSEGGMRALSKLQLNSLYGKFATNPDVTGKIPTLTENGVVGLVRGADEVRNPVYTAAGVFITSYARDVTIRAAQANYDAFAYADTDSLHLLESTIPDVEQTGLHVHPSQLGSWKHEYNFQSAYYVRAKAYLEHAQTGEYHNAVAGIPVHMSAELRFADLHPGANLRVHHGEVARWESDNPHPLLHGKLTPTAVPGGIVLTQIPFELKLG